MNFLQEKEDKNVLKNLMLLAFGQKNNFQLKIIAIGFKLQCKTVDRD